MSSNSARKDVAALAARSDADRGHSHPPGWPDPAPDKCPACYAESQRSDADRDALARLRAEVERLTDENDAARRMLQDERAAVADLEARCATLAREAKHWMDVAGTQSGELAAALAARDTNQEGPDWTQAEWVEWSNSLAELLPERYDGDEAQEALIERFVREAAARDTDQGAGALRANIEAVLPRLPWVYADIIRAALARARADATEASDRSTPEADR